MATRSARVVFRDGVETHVPESADGAWWPRTRSLADELPAFFTAWPKDRGRIHRILYSPPDWDDRPRSVAVSERRVKTGRFPRDDTHQLTVTLANRSVRVITVIDPDASVTEASELMRRLTDADGRPPEDHPEWDNEGGHT